MFFLLMGSRGGWIERFGRNAVFSTGENRSQEWGRARGRRYLVVEEVVVEGEREESEEKEERHERVSQRTLAPLCTRLIPPPRPR